MIPVLVQLLEQCSATKYAYLCHPCVQHVSKIKREGMLPHLQRGGSGSALDG